MGQKQCKCTAAALLRALVFLQLWEILASVSWRSWLILVAHCDWMTQTLLFTEPCIAQSETKPWILCDISRLTEKLRETIV